MRRGQSGAASGGWRRQQAAWGGREALCKGCGSHPRHSNRFIDTLQCNGYIATQLAFTGQLDNLPHSAVDCCVAFGPQLISDPNMVLLLRNHFMSDARWWDECFRWRRRPMCTYLRRWRRRQHGQRAALLPSNSLSARRLLLSFPARSTTRLGIVSPSGCAHGSSHCGLWPCAHLRRGSPRLTDAETLQAFTDRRQRHVAHSRFAAAVAAARLRRRPPQLPSAVARTSDEARRLHLITGSAAQQP